MRSVVLGEPYPHNIWLDVRLDGVPPALCQGVMERIRRIPGWHSGLTGKDGGALRYAYADGAETSIPERARAILSEAGAANPGVTSFVVWRLELDFRGPLHVSVFAPMTASMREMAVVLDTHNRGSLELTGLVVEFRGQPSVKAVERILTLTQPHRAA
jgi:hypothetical protein